MTEADDQAVLNEVTATPDKEVLINCDMGESFGPWKMGQDEDIMPYIDAANIACGYHAGDPQVMIKTLMMALEHNVKPGAHPGYPDKQGFGRRSMQFMGEELQHLLWYQIGALAAMSKALGAALFHVKPHGALYNDMMKSETVLRNVMMAVAKLDSHLKLMIQATPKWQEHQQLASKFGIELLFEAFSDRGYQNNGLLLPRGEEGALLCSQQAVAQSQSILQRQQVTSIEQQVLTLKIDTLCIHGDGENALHIAKTLR